MSFSLVAKSPVFYFKKTLKLTGLESAILYFFSVVSDCQKFNRFDFTPCWFIPAGIFQILTNVPIFYIIESKGKTRIKKSPTLDAERRGMVFS